MANLSYKGLVERADALTAENKASFLHGYDTVLLPVGFELWRFVDQQSSNRFSDYWVDPYTMKSIMGVLHTSGSFSQEFKKDNVRNSLAILQHWSRLSWRVKVKLKQEVIAYVGETGPQKGFTSNTDKRPRLSAGDYRKIETYSDNGSKIEKFLDARIGGGTQYVIPRFKGLPNHNQWASIELFVHI